MTKKTLEEAIKLQKEIEYFRKGKEEHEYAEKKCWRNFSDVANRKFS